MQHAPIDLLVDDASASDDDPIIAPLTREQIEPLLGGRRDAGVGAPERALMRALLQDAVLCLIGQAAPTKERALLKSEARHWVTSRSREWVFAFVNVCEELGINPDYARTQLLAMADRGSIGPVNGVDADDTVRCDARSLRGVRGLRHGGQRPRKAIHFVGERRRRRVHA